MGRWKTGWRMRSGERTPTVRRRSGKNGGGIDQGSQAESLLEAAFFLRKLRKLLTEIGRTVEWEKCLARIRADHARKRSLLAVLDSLEKTPIIKKRHGKLASLVWRIYLACKFS